MDLDDKQKKQDGETTMNKLCNPRHTLGKDFKYVDCGKSSQQCHDDFEPRDLPCGCSDIMLSKEYMTLIQCGEHAKESMLEMN